MLGRFGFPILFLFLSMSLTYPIHRPAFKRILSNKYMKSFSRVKLESFKTKRKNV